jgi:hypothetical protein
MAYLGKRVLRGFATIKSLTLWKVSRGNTVIRELCNHKQVVQDFGRKATAKNGVKRCEKSHMRLLNKQGTQAFLKANAGGKFVPYIVNR